MLHEPDLRPPSIRVFLASTFQDMQEERKELAHSVFPVVRQECERRGVGFSVVDFRWGITDDQVRNHEVIGICLSEIDRCRPFFIGLLGERYGWIPEVIPPDALKRFPWLSERAGRSITELEIEYGAMRGREDGDESTPALFYLRDPRYTDTKPDVGDPDNELAPGRLAELKARIRSNPQCRVRNQYADPLLLAELVHKDLNQLIDNVCPPIESFDSFQQQTLDHWHFAVSRARVYVGKHSSWRRLDRCLTDGRSMFLCGTPGAGKTTLLAHWLARRYGSIPTNASVSTFLGGARQLPMRGKHSQRIGWLFHFASVSSSALDMLRRFTAQLHQELDWTRPQSSQPSEVRAQFLSAIQAFVEKTPLLLLIDGVDGLECEPGLGNYSWLPQPLPKELRVVFSGSDDAYVNRLKQAGIKPMRVTPLSRRHRSQLVAAELHERMSRQLPDATVRRIAVASEGSSPFYLSAIVEELRVVEQHSSLEKRLDDYLSASSETDLYCKVLARLEREYSPERNLTRDVFSFLWASRQGLSEAELRDLTGTPASPLPTEHWSPAFSASQHLLEHRGRILTLTHPPVRLAVEQQFLRDASQKERIRDQLAKYWKSQPMTQRSIVEHPWQLAQNDRWIDLEALLIEPKFLALAWPTMATELKQLAAILKANTGHSLTTLFAKTFGQPIDNWRYAWDVCQYLELTGHLAEASQLNLRLLAPEISRQIPEETRLEILSMRVQIAVQLGDLKHASSVLQQLERLDNSSTNDVSRACTRNLRGGLLRAQGNLAAALSMYSSAKRQFASAIDLGGVAATIGEIGKLSFDLNQLDEALHHFSEQEQLGLELGDLGVVRESMMNLGAVFLARSDYDRALDCFNRSAQLCQALGDRREFADVLGNRAVALMELAQYDDAMHDLDVAESIYVELLDDVGHATTKLRQAYMFGIKMKQVRYAVGIATEGVQIAEQNGSRSLVSKLRNLLDELQSNVVTS